MIQLETKGTDEKNLSLLLALCLLCGLAMPALGEGHLEGKP